MVTTPQQPAFEIEKGPLITAALLVALGALVASIGAILGLRAVLSHGRRFVGTMDPPLSEVAKTTWGQLLAAGSAGADAWRTSTASGRGGTPNGTD